MRILETRARAISSLAINPALMVLPKPDVVGEQCHRQAAAERDEVSDLMVVGL